MILLVWMFSGMKFCTCTINCHPLTKREVPLLLPAFLAFPHFFLFVWLVFVDIKPHGLLLVLFFIFMVSSLFNSHLSNHDVETLQV